MKLPAYLYKYLKFDILTLESLCGASSYYSDPRKFNDPLDCNPTLEKGVKVEELESLCQSMLDSKYRQTKSFDELSESTADKEIAELKYMATEVDRDDYYLRLLGSRVKKLLADELSPSGVLSLAERWGCPLMWGHYSAGHTGICLEFEVAGRYCPSLSCVRYSHGARIKAKDLIEWRLKGSDEAKQRVLKSYFFAKSSDWAYEREWRDVRPVSGAHSMPFRIQSVYFGFACETWARACLVKLLSGSPCEPCSYYEIIRKYRGSVLGRRRLGESEIQEMKLTAVRSSPNWDFDTVSELDLSSARLHSTHNSTSGTLDR